MKLPKIKGIIDRRILINYQVEKQVIEKFLPSPFQPKLINGKGIAGICLIRLKEIRPTWLPKQIGISSENGAHRIAVEWIEDGKLKEGVYIPRRDTSSILNSLAGGTIFPGTHHLAKFIVKETQNSYEVSFTSKDKTSLSIKARDTELWNEKSVFENLEAVSSFFENGSIGYSPGKRHYDGLQLKTYQWRVSPLKVESVHSTFFDDRNTFPAGSVVFDNALLMKNIAHEWIGLKNISRP